MKWAYMRSIIGGLLIFIFLTATYNKCERIEKKYFSPEFLQDFDVYSQGDKFFMINTKNDTFEFYVKSRSLEIDTVAMGLGFNMVEIERLEYRFDIYNKGNKYWGKVYASSLEGEKLGFFIKTPCIYEGDVLPDSNYIDTLKLNGVSYSKVICNPNCCFAKGIGFIRFTNYYCDDTLTLIK